MAEIIVAQQVFKIEDWMIKDDGGLVLQEKEIKREKKVRICVNSKELTHHNRPHIHAYYEDKEYSIAIDENYDLLAPAQEDKLYRFIIKTMFNDSLVQKYRHAWNENTDSKIKFVKNGCLYSSIYQKV